jgi:metalloprotein, YbeY/UPF0054 family
MNPSVTADAAVFDLDVLVESCQWLEKLPEAHRVCRVAAIAAIAHALPAHTTQPASACVLLTDDARLRDLNRTFRGVDRATNVLAFPAVPADVLAAAGADGRPADLGDVAIAFETTVAEARNDGKPLADHLSHLVVHAILHLLGHDHETDSEAVAMEALEIQILAHLGVADPYAASNEP